MQRYILLFLGHNVWCLDSDSYTKSLLQITAGILCNVLIASVMRCALVVRYRASRTKTLSGRFFP